MDNYKNGKNNEDNKWYHMSIKIIMLQYILHAYNHYMKSNTFYLCYLQVHFIHTQSYRIYTHMQYTHNANTYV